MQKNQESLTNERTGSDQETASMQYKSLNSLAILNLFAKVYFKLFGILGDALTSC